ncbi:hypothetical protein E5D57_006910 [Metarhizium anisopliae]|nr:hypothetical protein E5D57_006910 [Metarhizium anisopliae]
MAMALPGPESKSPEQSTDNTLCVLLSFAQDAWRIRAMALPGLQDELLETDENWEDEEDNKTTMPTIKLS